MRVSHLQQRQRISGGNVAHRPRLQRQALQVRGRATTRSTTVGGKSAAPAQQQRTKTVRGRSSSPPPQQPQTQRGKTVRGTSATSSPKQGGGASAGSRFYSFITGFPFPLGPTFTRTTIRREIEPGTIWVFEQTQALEVFNVYTPVRMTVIKLKSGGLWVHAPVAPTDECVRLIKELGAPVEYIVLPTFAYEHKAFVGPFSRRFPKAKVYIAPYQWSWPLNLPPQFFGIFPAGELRSDDPDVPWAGEIEQKLFLPPSIGVGDFVRFSEVAFLHRRTGTLLVTDALVYVSEKVPEVIPRAALLETARDNFLARFIAGDRTPEEVRQIAQTGPAEDTEENRRKGWIRMALLVLYFGPGNLLEPQESFAAISNRLIVGPVVETLVYSKVPGAVRKWVDEVVRDWSFRQVIPCHFAAPVRAGPAEFKQAFAFAYEGQQDDEEELEEQAAAPSGPAGLFAAATTFLKGLTGAGAKQKLVRPAVFPESDMKTLNTLNNALLSVGAVKANADVE